MNIRLFSAGVLLLISACTPPPPDYASQGAALLQPFKTHLKTALMEGMRNGPAEAISACSVEAPSIASSLSANGVVMGRSSHKLRNPANAPPDWLVPLLEDYAAGTTELAPLALEFEDGRIGYAEPIMVQAMCLNCHGADLHPDVAARLAEQYPDDMATGFSEGDFRGVFWVEFPAAR